MKKLKELWQYPVFRWCVYQMPLLVFGFMLKSGVLDVDDYKSEHYKLRDTPYEFGNLKMNNISVLIWVLILTFPVVWVWRKPLISFLNKKAEEE
jgi:hypothetical protein